MNLYFSVFCLIFCQNVSGQNISEIKQIQSQINAMLDRIEALETENIDLKAKVQQLKNTTENLAYTGVQFSAYLNQGGDIGSESEDYIISFNGIFYNHGDGFDGTTFQAPITGFYRFEFDAVQNAGGLDTEDIANRISILRNGELEVYFLDSGPKYGYYNHIHFAFQMYLMKSERINVILNQNDWLYAGPSNRIYFSGELLFAQ